MAPAVKPCFCGEPKRNAEVRCSQCKAYFHYECLGLAFKELCNLLNEDPGIYLCKTCSPKCTVTNRNKFLTSNPGCHIFEYDNATYERMQSPDPLVVPAIEKLSQALESKFESLEKRLVDSFVKVSSTQNQILSYAAVASKNAPLEIAHGPGVQPRSTNGAARGPPKADPKRSILVSRLDDPKEFAQNVIKAKLTSIKPDIIPMISHARVLNSGKLLIEARSPEIRDQFITLPSASFGKNARIYAMDSQRLPNRPRGVIARGMPANVDVVDFETQVKYEYPSSTEFTVISGREGSRFCSVKFLLPNSEEYNRILTHGCFLDLNIHLRVEPLVPGPRRCFNCQRYGHIAKACRSQKRCANCGSSDHDHSQEQPCQAPTKCCNCGGAHEARNKECPSFKSQLAIARSAAYNNV